jgi:hypothetical protein
MGILFTLHSSILLRIASYWIERYLIDSSRPHV